MMANTEYTANSRPRKIYVFEFEDGSAYVGLTCDVDRRYKEHTRRPKNPGLAALISTKHNFVVLPGEYTARTAGNAEKAAMDDYENRGWSLLNLVSGGGIGGGYIVWTSETIKAEALRYQTKVAFKKGNYGAYQYACKYGLINASCSHMEPLRKIRYSLKEIKECAAKFNCRADFKRKNRKLYCAAQSRGILNEVCAHMEDSGSLWTEETIKDEANRYATRTEFVKANPSAYRAARKLGILSEACEHMARRAKPMEKDLKWSRANIAEEAKKYRTRTEFTKGNGAAYATASKLGILNEVCAHMVSGRKRNAA